MQPPVGSTAGTDRARIALDRFIRKDSVHPMSDGRPPSKFTLFLVNPAPEAERISFSVSTPRALPVLFD